MIMNKVKVFLAVLMLLCLVSCTEQARVRSFGGEMSIELPKGKRLIMATWKEVDLFYLLEDMDSLYIPKNKEFIENSSYGILESKIIFIESK